MKLTLSDWASIGEIVSGVAVVITLIFLIVGIRENTAVTRSTAFDRSMDSLNQFRMEIAKDPELTRLWVNQREVMRPPEPDEPQIPTVEQYRLILLAGTLWTMYEKSYFAHQYGLIGDNEWFRFERQICSRMEDMGSQAWERLATTMLTPQFTEYSLGLCSRSR